MRTRTIIFTCVLVAILTIPTLSMPAANAKLSTNSLNPPSGTRVVLIELEASPQRNATLATYNIIPFVEYSLYVLAYANDEQIAAMEGNGILVGKMTNRTIVDTRGYQFDTMNGEPSLPSDLRIDTYEPNTEGIYIVQLVGPLKDEWLTALKEKGVEFYESIPTYNYLVRMNSNLENEVRDLWFVQWVGIYQPAYKFSPNLTTGTMYISIWNVLSTKQTIKTLSSLAQIIYSSFDSNNENSAALINTDASNIPDIAGLPDVVWLYQYETPTLMDETSSEITGGIWTANMPYGGFGNYANLQGWDGTNVVVAIADSGLGSGQAGNAGHVDFGNRVLGGKDYTQSYNWYDFRGHGTHVAGIIAANGNGGTGVKYGSTNYYVGAGVAPAAELYAQKILRDDGNAYPGIPTSPELWDDFFQDAYNADAYVHSNSWGGIPLPPTDFAYDLHVRDSAASTNGLQPMVIIVGAGNQGPGTQTLGSPGLAKNVITVGATENYLPDGDDYGQADTDFDLHSATDANNIDDIASYSSRGLADDTRIKPDVVAPGSIVLSTRTTVTGAGTLDGVYTEDPRYLWCSGTSMATPHVAGSAADIIEWWIANHGGVRPMPAMVKALLINTAKPISASPNIPNGDIGWGRVYLPDIVSPVANFALYDNPQPLSSTVNSYNRYVRYDKATQPLKITLVWTDPAGISLKNNLNLKITSPSGLIYYGNAFTNGFSVAGAAAGNTNIGSDWDTGGMVNTDDINNVECVYLPASSLVSGAYKIEVIAESITADAIPGGVSDQDFALVVYNGVEDITPPTSAVSKTGAYWRNTSPITVDATASDALSGVASVQLYFRYSVDNITFNAYVATGTPDTTSPYSFSFAFASGQGYYEFYTRATDRATNIEAAPGTADAGYGYDATLPTKPTLSTPSNGASLPTTAVLLDWETCSDNRGVANYVIYLSGTSGSYSWTTTNSYYQTPQISLATWSWKVRAVDYAGNIKDSDTWSFMLYQPITYGTVSGYVCSATNSQGISGAVVDYYYTPINEPNPQPTIFSSGEGSSTSAVTNAYGHYTIYNVPAGYHNFQAIANGYYPRIESNVYVSSNGINLGFTLSSVSGGGGGGGGGCLIPGTNISTPNGDVKIEDLKEGDIVLSYNLFKGLIEPDTVCRTLVHPSTDEYLVINGCLGLTANHLIYVGNDIKRADELQQGDILRTLEGNILVSSITTVSALTVTYNIEVENNNNYFAEGILVHNVYKGAEGCPFVYSWDGDSFEEENNILPRATNPDRNQLDVDDYYMLQNELQSVNGSYLMQISEPALERTHLDDIQLAIIDYNYSDVQLAITPEGIVKTIIEPLGPVSCIDSTGSNVSELVDEMNDGYRLKAEHNETLTVYFPRVLFFNEAKLVISHKATIDLLPYDVPIDPRLYKCSIHIQTRNPNGRWYDFASLPARMNWALDCVDITQLGDRLKAGEPIRLLITGTHFIDFIGLDITDSLPLDIDLVKPTSVAYIDQTEPINLTGLLLQRDQQYVTVSPNQGIQLKFPNSNQTTSYRAFAIIPHGHYYNLPEIAISQPVTIHIGIPTNFDEGTLNMLLEEITVSSESSVLQGLSIDLSLNHQEEIIMSFNQDPLMNYQLHAWLINSTKSFRLPLVFTSVLGSRTITLMINPSNPIVYPLENILWNTTGASFNRYSGQYEVLKNTVIQYDLNRYYQYEVSVLGSYEWTFGDGSWTNDERPTHQYEQPGRYLLNLTIFNVTGDARFLITSTNVKVVQSPPVTIIDVYQKVNMTLTISGRKDNTVGIRIYEDGTLIQSCDVMRTAGPPNTQTIELNKYLGRVYDIELVYTANHKGANPISLIFTSGVTIKTFSKNFNTNNGYNQIVSVPTSYLEDVVVNNPAYVFDASDSYDIDCEIVSYEWDFGDNSTSEGIMTEHTYSAPGLYTVILTITDDDGAIAKEMLVVEVRQT